MAIIKTKAPQAEIISFKDAKKRLGRHEPSKEVLAFIEEIEVYVCEECEHNSFYVTAESDIICNHCLKAFLLPPKVIKLKGDGY